MFFLSSFPIISQWELHVAINHGNQSSNPNIQKTKKTNIAFPLSDDVYMKFDHIWPTNIQ